jgi:DNA-binding MarR family transcriptional regulator
VSGKTFSLLKPRKRQIPDKQVIGNTIVLRTNKNALRTIENELATTKNHAGAKGSEIAEVKPLLRVGILVHDMSRLRRTMFDQAVSHLGITRAQGWVLSNLLQHKSDGMNQTEIVRLLFVGKPTIGGLLDRLADGGMVERRFSDDDLRVKRIFITDKGYGVISRMSPIATKLNEIFLENILEQDVKVAELVLDRMKKTF